MDFEAVKWDVESEANELDKSLFQNNMSKKNKKYRKRQAELNSHSKDVVVNKKKKVNDGVQKKTEGSFEKKAESKATEVSDSLSRKERRNKKWQEKILKRKLMNEKNKADGLNKSETGSDILNSPENKYEASNKLTVQKSEVLTGMKSRRDWLEKRKLKSEQTKNKKRQKVEQTAGRSDDVNVSDAKLDKQNKLETVNNIENENEVGTPSFTNESTKQMNRKERRKMQRKQKLKASKLSLKNKTENESGTDEINHETVSKDGKVSKKQNGKKNKAKTEACETQEMEVKEEASCTGNEVPLTSRGNEVAGTSSVKNKKKRKRVCKRNKFKGYVKPETVVTKDSADSSGRELDIKSSLNASETNKAEEKSCSLSEISVEAKNVKKDKKKKTLKESNKVEDTVTTTRCNEEGESSKQNMKKKIALDPEKLKAMLSPSSGKKFSTVEMDKTVDLDIKEKEKKPKTLLEKSRERLNAARFRYINEQLYTATGQEALKMFKNDKEAFSVYHEGFQGQVEKWPTNPIDVIIGKIQTKPKHLVLADFGCGDAKLARSVPNEVHSFDLVALNEHVTVCDMSKVPLKDATVDIAVFCLSLMGTNLSSYVQEAYRVLKSNGTLMIAEVTSRFDNMKGFVLNVEKMGFKLKQQDSSNKMFVMMEFKKTSKIKAGSSEEIQLKPCLYKKR